MPTSSSLSLTTLPRDLTAGLVVFLVALPLCLGVALASNAPLFSGVLAGIVGGILVGMLSGSHTSVSGPAAGLTAVVAAQIASLGSFQAFLLAVVLAGLIQIGLGLARAGFIAAFFPSSVIKGLLAAIGVILILKQIPHVLGHDPDPEGDMAFQQPDHENTFSELGRTLGDIHPGAAVDRPRVDRAAGRLGQVEAAEEVACPGPPGRGAAGRRDEPVVPAARRRVGHRAEPPRAGAGGGQPGRVPRVPAVARLLAVVEPGGLHRRRDDRRRGLAGDAAEPGGGRQDRPAAAHLAPEPGTAGPGGRQRGRRADRRAAGHVGHRPQLGEHQRRRAGRSSRRSSTASCCWSASRSCRRG